MSFISRANFCKAVAVCVAVLAGLPLAGAREFRVADTQSEDYPTVQALMFMARVVEERTGGRHHIRVFHSRQLGEEKDTIEQTRVGAIDLTRTEFALLELFLRNQRQVLTRSIIFERVWGYDFGPTSNSLDVYIGYLRRKTEEGGAPRLIHTIRGVGYALREA